MIEPNTMFFSCIKKEKLSSNFNSQQESKAKDQIDGKVKSQTELYF